MRGRVPGAGAGRRLARICFAALGCSGLLASATAQATTTATVGQLFAPADSCAPSFTDLQTGVASGTSYTVPFAGVITSWAFQDGATPVAGLKLKVARPAGGGSFTIIGEAAAGAQLANSVNTYQTQIPVAAGDLIGIHEEGGDCVTGTASSADTNAFAAGDPAPGTTSAYCEAWSSSSCRLPVATLSCVVPTLKGRKLKADKKKLRNAGCKLGKVTGHGKKVRKQSVKPGTELPPGSRVNVKLG